MYAARRMLIHDSLTLSAITACLAFPALLIGNQVAE
jgi:hypothetical protein